MPRYMVQRTFPDGLNVPVAGGSADACGAVVQQNFAREVTWLHSYVSADRRATFCIYDAPDPEAIRRAAAVNELPVDTITEVSVLDPYFYA